MAVGETIKGKAAAILTASFFTVFLTVMAREANLRVERVSS